MPPKANPHRLLIAPQWLALLSALLLLGSALAWSRYDARRQLEASEKERLLAQTTVLNYVIGQSISAANSVLLAQAQEWASTPDSQAASRRLLELDTALQGIRSLLILDRNGVSQASSRAELIGRNFSEKDYFRYFKDSPWNRNLFVSQPFRGVLGAVIIVLARPIIDKYGAFSGVATATVDPEFLVLLLKAARTTPDMWTAIAHGDGTLYLLEPERSGAAPMNLNEPGSPFRVHLERGKETSLLDGRMEGFGDYGSWAVSTIQPQDVQANAPLVVIVGRSFDAILMTWKTDSLVLGLAYLFIAAVACAMLHFHMRRKRAFEQELERSARALEAKAHFVQSVTDGIPGMIGYWDDELRCQFANRAYLEWFGRSPEQLIGIPMRELLGEELYKLNEPYIQAALWGEQQTFERAIKKADGSIGQTLARYIPDRQEGEVRGFFVLVSDVTELKQAQQQLESLVKDLNNQAVTDGLTGLTNRRHFWELARIEMTRSRRYGFELCLIMLDIDKFKSINDGFGHAAGDEVLRSLSSVMTGELRETDVTGRLGGEEFGILLPQTGEAEAIAIAERLRAAVLATPVAFEDTTISYTVSLGVATANKNETSVDDLVKRADMALYQAKETGRNKVCCATELDPA